MGSIRKKNATKSLPKDAQVVKTKDKRTAKWTDFKGKVRTAPVIDGRDGTLRIVVTSRIYLAKYRDENGQVVEVSTGCKGRQAAMTVLRDLENRAEKVRSGIISIEEQQLSGNASRSLELQFKDYERHGKSKGVTQKHIDETLRRLREIAQECRFTRIPDLAAAPVEEWLVLQVDSGMGARTRKRIPGSFNRVLELGHTFQAYGIQSISSDSEAK